VEPHRYEQVREILGLRILPELRALRRRLAGLRWLALATLLVALAALTGVGALVCEEFRCWD
tara:strand:+ start:187 stop:372 length:186 start_codon:yes stop_codon:yes gene_type:complete